MTKIPVFAGLGSEALFSDKTADQAKRDSTTPHGAILLRACHDCFRAEITRAANRDPSLGIDLNDFRTAFDILEPSRRYHRNAIVQHAALFVVQSLRYLRQHERAFIRVDPKIATAVSGFCAGLFPAVAAATSTSLLEYLSRAEDCFRIAVLLGIGTDRSRRALRVPDSKLPWSMVVDGMGPGELRELLSNYVPTQEPLVPVYISSINTPLCVTLSAEGPALREFLDDHLSSKCRVRPTNLYSLYHNQDALADAREYILRDFKDRKLKFPALSDLVAPIISTVDGALITRQCNTTSTALLELILDMTLSKPTDWVAVQNCILSLAEGAKTSNGEVYIQNFGPGYGALRNRKDLADGISVAEMSCERYSDKDAGRDYSTDDIAIVGMSVNLPGADDEETLWHNLMNGFNACSEIPSSRFHIEDYYTGDGSKPVNPKRSMATKFGNFLNNPFLFDNTFFDISPREARSIDPQQRVMLQTAFRALENAGYVPDSSETFMRETFGCFIGNATLDYTENLRNDVDVYYSPGTLRAFLAGRISYAFQWSGPSFTIDTACSSSLVAIHQASRALLAGDCKAAVAGGVNIITSPDMYLGLDRAHFLSPTGQCKAFDQSADGYCRSEGCAAFVLKKLSDAIAENDQVLGVIKGTDLNQSGMTHSITHPHSPTQEKLFRKLLAKTSIHPHDISVVEAHGTGTQAGDPNEVLSLRSVLCEARDPRNPLHITSIKANIGHCEAASGGAALAKLLLMLRHSKIPPQPSLVTLNLRIEELGTDGALINQQAASWNTIAAGKPRLAMLNNFGAAGSNAAMILQEYIAPDIDRSPNSLTYFLGCSAKDSDSLIKMKNELISLLESSTHQRLLADICYTSTARRQMHKYRLSVTTSSTEDLAAKLKTAKISEIADEDVPIVFLFGGQGSQYLGMGRELMDLFPEFNRTLMRCDQLLRDWNLPSCLEVICPSTGTERDPKNVSQLQAFQTGVFVLEVAVAKLFISFGIIPDVVVGHSLGEFAALVIAGVMDLESGLRLVASRARLIIEKCELQATSMLAISSSTQQMRKLIEADSSFDGLEISCENSPEGCVVGGNLETLKRLKDHLSSSNTRTTFLDVPVAYHTAALDPVLEDLECYASQLPLSRPTIPVASNVLGRIVDITEDIFDPKYFASHCRQTVVFDQSIEAILDRDDAYAGAQWIEIGPHPALLSMMATRLSCSTSSRVTTLRKDKHPSETFSDLFSSLYTSGIQCNWRAIFEGLSQLPSLCPLPLMPFNLKEFAIPLRRELLASLTEDVESVPIAATPYRFLSTIVSLPKSGGELDAVFETPMHVLAEYVEGHIVCGFALCPASVYQEMALSAVHFLDGSNSPDVVYQICDVSYARPLLYLNGLSVAIRIVIGGEDTAKCSRKFTITSYDTEIGPEDAQTHCFGIIKKRGAAKIIEKFARKERIFTRRKATFLTEQTFSAKTMYEKIFPRVVKYSATYRAVQQIKLDEASEEILASCKLPRASTDETFAANPVLVDTLLHVAGFAANLNVDDDDVCICSSVSSAIVLRNDFVSGIPFEVHCSNFVNPKTGTVLADAYAMDSDGILAAVKGMEFKRSKLSKMTSTFNFASRQTRTAGSPASPPVKPALHHRPSSTSTSPASSRDLSPIPAVASSGQQSVIELVAETCGVDISQVTPQTKLNGLGIDSLMVFELEEKLQNALSVQLRSGELAKCETVRDVEMLATPATSQPSSPAPRAMSHESSTEQRKARNRCKSGLGSVHPSISDLDLARSKSRCFKDEISEEDPEIDLSPNLRNLLTRSLRLEDNPQVIEQDTIVGGNIDSACPVFFLPPGAGFCPPTYYTLQNLRRPAYAVHDRKTLESSHNQWNSISDIAEDYAELVIKRTELRPSTAVIIAGYSFGGVVAFEVARSLEESCRRKVAGVLLIDAPPPFNHKPLSRETINAHIGIKFQRDYSRGSPSEFQKIIGPLTIRNNLRAAALLRKYKPKISAFSPNIILLRSKEGFQIDGVELPENAWLNDRSDIKTAVVDWEQLVGGEVKVTDISGNHFEAFETQNIAGTSAAIKKACDEFDGR